MAIYRCSNCGYTTSDPSEPECPNCFNNLAEVEENTEDLLEEDSQLFGQERGL